MSDPWMDRLSDYLDGELPRGEAEGLERHLEACADCRQVLTGLRAVVARAGGLGERQPPRDLWPAIAARIGVAAAPVAGTAPEGAGGSADAPPETGAAETGGPVTGSSRPSGRAWAEEMRDRLDRRHRRAPRRFSFSLPQLAAAAIAVILLSGTMVWLLTSGPGIDGDPGMAVERPAPTGEAVLAGIDDRARAGGYDEAITQLEAILFYGEEALDTATVRTLRTSLEKVDGAIAEARTALAEDPGNSYLQQHLGDTMRKKAEFLRQAVTLVATD